MRIKIKLFLIVAIVALVQSLSFAQVVGTPFIIPHYKNRLIFEHTGTDQSWTVPENVSEIYVDILGAQGGSLGASVGGGGGRVRCRISVSPGQVLAITVGGQPISDEPPYGFGGRGGVNTVTISQKARAGGGLSAISTGHPVSHANALAIAAGGGGASGQPGYWAADGGGRIGGTASQDFGGTHIGGRGATQTAGGAPGTPADANSPNPTAGTALNGGTGGTVVVTASGGWNGGGGGGAGYFGGGGGAGGGLAQAGGGGGSSWINSTSATAVGAINMSNQNRNGHGRVIIYY
jgi:hypothetical protein